MWQAAVVWSARVRWVWGLSCLRTTHLGHAGSGCSCRQLVQQLDDSEAGQGGADRAQPEQVGRGRGWYAWPHMSRWPYRQWWSPGRAPPDKDMLPHPVLRCSYTYEGWKRASATQVPSGRGVCADCRPGPQRCLCSPSACPSQCARLRASSAPSCIPPCSLLSMRLLTTSPCME